MLSHSSDEEAGAHAIARVYAATASSQWPLLNALKRNEGKIKNVVVVVVVVVSMACRPPFGSLRFHLLIPRNLFIRSFFPIDFFCWFMNP